MPKLGSLQRETKANSKQWIFSFREVMREKQKGTELEIIF
jgi:hypothetical protein